MYTSIAFPVAATEAVRFEAFSVFVDPTFACVVVQYARGYDVFRYDEEVCSFDFECSDIPDVAALKDLPGSGEVSSALWHLLPWLDAEVAAVKLAWLEFFDGVRQLPMLSSAEKRTLRETRMSVIVGLRVSPEACTRDYRGRERDNRETAFAR